MDKNEIQNLIREVIEKTNVSVKEISLGEESAGESMWFNIEVSEPHFYTGKGGEGLSALNHLVRKIIEGRMLAGGAVPSSPREGTGVVSIDINGFQKRKIEGVRAVAHMMAERARYFKSNIEVDPMSPFERRIVHEFLSKEADLQTESVGFGSTRRVVIKYIGSI